jgi:hypothetical protein
MKSRLLIKKPMMINYSNKLINNDNYNKNNSNN